MRKGRIAHREQWINDAEKRKIDFTLVPSNFGKREGLCNHYSARLSHNQVLNEDEVVQEMCEHFRLPKHIVVHNIQQISDYLVSRIRLGYQVTFGGFTVGLAISGRFDAMNAEFDPERNKIEVVVSPRYELKDAAAYLKPVNNTDTVRPEVETIVCSGMARDEGMWRIFPGKICNLNGSNLLGPLGMEGTSIHLEDASGRIAAELTILKCGTSRMDFKLEKTIEPGDYRFVLRCINADRKSYALARCNVHVV